MRDDSDQAIDSREHEIHTASFSAMESPVVLERHQYYTLYLTWTCSSRKLLPSFETTTDSLFLKESGTHNLTSGRVLLWANQSPR